MGGWQATAGWGPRFRVDPITHVSQPPAGPPRRQAQAAAPAHHTRTLCSGTWHTRINQACVGAWWTECWLGRLVVANRLILGGSRGVRMGGSSGGCSRDISRGSCCSIRLVLNTATQQLRVCCVCVPARGKGMPTAAVAEHTRGGPRQHLIATAAVRIGTVAVAEAAGVAIAWRGAAAAAVA